MEWANAMRWWTMCQSKGVLCRCKWTACLQQQQHPTNCIRLAGLLILFPYSSATELGSGWPGLSVWLPLKRRDSPIEYIELWQINMQFITNTPVQSEKDGDAAEKHLKCSSGDTILIAMNLSVWSCCKKFFRWLARCSCLVNWSFIRHLTPSCSGMSYCDRLQLDRSRPLTRSNQKMLHNADTRGYL